MMYLSVFIGHPSTADKKRREREERGKSDGELGRFHRFSDKEEPEDNINI